MRHRQPKLRHDMYYAPRYIPVIQLDESISRPEKRSLITWWFITVQLMVISAVMLSVFSFSLFAPLG